VRLIYYKAGAKKGLRSIRFRFSHSPNIDVLIQTFDCPVFTHVVRFSVLTAARLKIIFFQNMIPCSQCSLSLSSSIASCCRQYMSPEDGEYQNTRRHVQKTVNLVMHSYIPFEVEIEVLVILIQLQALYKGLLNIVTCIPIARQRVDRQA
jgi:hypothetical protein